MISSRTPRRGKPFQIRLPERRGLPAYKSIDCGRSGTRCSAGRDQSVTPETFRFRLNWQRLREARRRERSHLLCCSLTDTDPAKLWAFYLQLVEIEQAFKELTGNLAIRPVYHQSDARIEAHICVAFMAYCLQITLISGFCSSS